MLTAKKLNIVSNKQEITNSISGFPVACYYSEFSPGTYDYIDWHWHVELQLCLTIRGTVYWGTESQKTLVPTGEGIFINSQRVHMARAYLDREAAFFCLDIPPDFLCPDKASSLFDESVRPVLEEEGLNAKMICPDTLEGSELLRLLSEMAKVFDEKEEGYEFELISDVFRLWKLLRVYLENDIRRDMKTADVRFREILMYLQKHYAEETSLDEIAKHIGLSRSECCRYFKKQSGQTIFDYLARYRLHKSMDMLISTDYDIAHIAQTCGFSSQSYYTRRFRELTGITPRQYRLQKR